jgi:hypothetical protein
LLLYCGEVFVVRVRLGSHGCATVPHNVELLLNDIALCLQVRICLFQLLIRFFELYVFFNTEIVIPKKLLDLGSVVLAVFEVVES